MKALLAFSFLLISVSLFAADQQPIFKVVKRPLAAVEHAFESYYASQSSSDTNVVSSAARAFGRDSSSITNAAGRVGVRFRICSCASVPVCYSVEIIPIDSKTTRIEASPLGELTGLPEWRSRRAARILDGITKELEKLP